MQTQNLGPHNSCELQACPFCAHRSVAAALAEAITALREHEQVCFRSSRNSAVRLFFSQQRLLLMRPNLGKAPSRSDWLALVALGEKAAAEKAA